MSSVDRRRFGYALGLLLSVAAPAAVAEPEHGRTFAFAVSRAEVTSTIKTIAVMPVAVTTVVPDADGVAARYESQIVARLTGAGFSVIPPSAMREIRERTKATLGGLYDPMTGEPIDERFKAFSEFSVNEYRATYKFDALLGSWIIVRSAEFSLNSASWDGIDDSTNGRSGWEIFWPFGAAAAASDYSGRIPALSFGVRLQNPNGKILYVGVGGLQVLGYLTAGWEPTRLGKIDPKLIMTDPARDARALSLALDPLLHGRVSSLPKVTRLPVPAPAIGAAPRLSRTELLAHFPRLVLASLDLEEIKQHDTVRLRYRDALTQKLTQLGFEIVGGDDYDRLWDAERKTMGGYFDPFTGRADQAKLKASRVRVFRSMPEHLAATAIALPRVIHSDARFISGNAEWDGVKEPLTGKSLTGKSHLANLFSEDPIWYHGGSLRAISLEVQIIDPEGEPLFEGAGGIQLTENFNPAGPEPLAESELFSDPAKDTRAIDIAFAPLVAPPPATPH
jgi:hypothetical protein